jgi:hypothetical protein
MTHIYQPACRFILAAFFLCASLLNMPVTAQQGDTLDVPWWDSVNEEVILNSLLTTIEADRVEETGKPPEGRVYRLEWGGFYVNTERIEADFPLHIVGDLNGDYIFFDQPPLIQIWRRPDLTVDDKMMMVYSDLTLKNLYILGNDDTGDQTHYEPIQIDGSNSRHVFDNVVFERSNFAIPAWEGGANNTIIFTNCVFRNLIPDPHASQWWGRAINTWQDQDTIIVENNTFFNVGYNVLQISDGAAAYARFNHNTIINVGRQPLEEVWWRDAFITNNLLINTRWHGEERSLVEEWQQDDPRSTQLGIFTIDDLPSRYGPEFGRRVLFAKNAAWLDTKFEELYEQDDIVGAYFFTRIAQEDFLDAYTDIVAVDTIWLDQRPDFAMYPVDEDFIDRMWTAIQDVRVRGIDGEPYFWGLPEVDPNVSIVWPLPENFTYTDADLLTAGTDGLPLGDLNWFPDAKADFEQNKEQYIQDIHAMLSAPVEHTVVDSRLGYRGELGGDAAEEVVEGDQVGDDPTHYAYMAGQGRIRWDFELEQEGQYDINVWVHILANTSRGNFVYVNGQAIMDWLGWGSFVWHPTDGPFSGMPYDEWTWTLITEEALHADSKGALTLPAGENSFEIVFNWGWMNYAGIQVLPAGSSEPVVELMITDAEVLEDLQLTAVGQLYTPRYFRFVNMGSGGSISMDMTVPEAGDYLFAIDYQNTGSPVTGEISVDGTTIPVDFQSEEEGRRLISFTDTTPLSAGTYTVTLSGSQVKVDFIQLIQERQITSVRINDLPKGFALEQNFPNPFNPSTTIQYNIPQTEKVVLKIYNLLGQEVRTLVNEVQMPGTYHAVFDAAHLASGVYFYRLQVGEFSEVKKMVFIK